MNELKLHDVDETEMVEASQRPELQRTEVPFSRTHYRVKSTRNLNLTSDIQELNGREYSML
jgi:hypothetical protein